MKNYLAPTVTISKLIMLVGAICALAVPSLGQTLNLYNVDASQFPRVTASYVALDNRGNPIQGLDASDFEVQESQRGGPTVNVTPTLEHDCETLTTDPEASVILILDRSNSMQDAVGGKIRFDYAKDAIRAFVNQMRFTGETRVCLVTFSGNYDVVVDWTNDPADINNALVDIEPLTSTDYSLPFESPGNNIYEKFRERPADIPKFAFFLTDGKPSPPIDDEVAFVNENTDSLNQQGIRFFSITIVLPNAHWTVRQLAINTGGKSIVTDEEDLVDLFALLALETRVREICTLTWIAPFGCDETSRNRTATVTLLPENTTTDVSYFAPETSVAGADLSDAIVFCGDPLPNNISNGSVTITARNSPIRVTGFDITPNGFFTLPTFAPFNLAPGQSRTLQVQFRQGAQQIFRQAKLTLESDPCPITLDLVGGQGLVVLTAPNGGELFSTCDTVTITWAGVLPSQPVQLEYSTDGGDTWNTITNDATDLQHKWLPPEPSRNYKIRVSVSPVPQYQWADRVGGASDETATAVAVLENDLSVYTTGYFDGPSQFGDRIVNNSDGDEDGFLCEWTADGRLVNTTIFDGTGTTPDRIVGVVADEDGNYYVAGWFESTSASLGPLSYSKGNANDVRNMFVQKFGPNNSPDWQNTGGGSPLNTGYASATRVGYRYFNGNLQVIVEGTFQRFIRVGPRRNGGFEESNRYNNNNNRPYYVIYDEQGFATLFENARPDGSWTMSSLIDTDNNGFEYETGTYQGVKNFSPPEINLPNRGGDDAFLSKFGAIPPSEDESDEVFVVSAPKVEFGTGSAVMDATIQGQTSTKTFTEILCNTGDHPVVLASAVINGANNGDFALISPDLGTRIDPGECVTIELSFTPSGIGVRTAQLDVEGSCGSTATLQITGEGTPGCSYDVKQTVDLGTIPQGASQNYPIACVIRNTGPTNLAGTLTAVGSADITVVTPALPFNFDLAPNECLDIEIAVNAQNAGEQTITFSYGLDELCGTPSTTVTVTVVAPDVNISSIDFGDVRVGTTADDVVTLTNNSGEVATITQIVESDPANPNFTVTNIPGTPFTLDPGASRDIDVRYNPQVRGVQTIEIEATVQGKPNTIVGTVRGNGILPAIEASGYTFAATTVGLQSAEIGEVIIRNTDANSALNIVSFAFETATTDFAWDGPLPGFPAVIAPNDELRIPVRFTPQAAGNRTVNVRIEHDAEPGDAPPYSNTLVVVQGLGIETSDIPPIDFGNVLTCITRSQVVTIVNPNPTAPLNCTAPVGSGDIAAFTLSETNDFVVPAGGTVDITVTYAPTAPGPQSVTYAIANDQGLSLNINASGTGVTTNADFRFYNVVQGTVGATLTTPVEVNLVTINDAEVDQVTLTFTYPADFVDFAGLTTPQQPGWTFTTDDAAPGTLVITGVSDPGVTLTTGPLVSPQFNVYLSSETEAPVKMDAATSLNCLVATGDSTSVSIKQVCYNEGRLIKLGDAQFGIGAPTPNPAREVTTIAYSTGIELSTRFDLVDATGNVVRTITTPVLKSGHYELVLETSELSTGQYFLRMASGPFVQTRRITVVK